MKQHHGFALVTTLLIGVVVTILVFGVAMTGMIDRMVSSNQRSASTAYYVAQAGLQQYKLLVFKSLIEFDADTRNGWCENPILGGIRHGDGTEVLLPGSSTAAIPFGNGTYKVSLDVNDDYLVLRSVGEADGAQATVQLVASVGAGPSTAWENALFAAGEAVGAKTINGHVGIHGSLHIVNGSADIKDEELDPLLLSGNSGIFNTYPHKNNPENDKFLQQLAAILPDPGFGKKVWDIDLCSRVKIKRGDLILDGNSQLGTEDHAIKSIHLETDKRLYYKRVGKDNALNSQADVDAKGANVFLTHPSDGTLYSSYSPYDLEMPVLQNGFPRETGVGAYDAYGTNGPVGGCGWLFDGATAVLPPKDPAAPETCGNADNEIRWVPASGNVPGYIVIKGNINFHGAGLVVSGNEPLRYKGIGNLRFGTSTADSKSQITINAAIAPLGGPGNKFPENALGLVTSGDIKFDVGANTDFPVAVLAYAAGNAKFEKQVNVLGSVVAGTFDVGKNVPHIMYHPGVRQASEVLCLPGSFCDRNEVPPNPGALSDISFERR